MPIAKSPKKIVYLFGAGATHAELLNTYPNQTNEGIFFEKNGLLMAGVSKRVCEVAKKNGVFSKEINGLLSPAGLSNVSGRHIGYDIKSGNRFIEVKSRPKGKIQPFIKLHNNLLRSIGRGLSNYYIYIVYDMDAAPKLVIVPPEAVLSNLETEVNLLIRGKVYNKIKPEKLKGRI